MTKIVNKIFMAWQFEEEERWLNQMSAEGWQLVMPMCITNGYEGYFPTMEAYLEGGYEARSSIFKAGVAEAVSGAGVEMLDTIRKNKGGC